VIAALHAMLYLAPGLVFIAFAVTMRRFAAVAIPAARGFEPAWSRPVVWLSVGLIGATGVVLVALGGWLASIVLRGAT
jgi:hypothetical protein